MGWLSLVGLALLAERLDRQLKSPTNRLAPVRDALLPSRFSLAPLVRKPFGFRLSIAFSLLFLGEDFLAKLPTSRKLLCALGLGLLFGALPLKFATKWGFLVAGVVHLLALLSQKSICHFGHDVHRDRPYGGTSGSVIDRWGYRAWTFDA